MNVNYYQVGVDFADYCNHQYSENDSFRARWNEYVRFGLFERFTSANSMTYQDKVQLMKGLGYGNGKVGILFSVNVQIWACIMPLLKFANQGLIYDYIRKLKSGEMVGAHAISEPETGSDVFKIKVLPIY